MPDRSYPWKHALVVGASSGIGEALAYQLGESGAAVALVARRTDALERIAHDITSRAQATVKVYSHDVRHTDEVEALFQQITTELGGLDLVVYASGIMPLLDPEAYPTADDLATIETNFSGAVAWLNQAALRFSRAGTGAIIGISSVAGDRGRRVNPVYGATKAALNAYLESLRNRLAVQGVKVLCVRPGYVETALITDLSTPGFLPRAAPAAVATEILRAAAADQRVLYTPRWWRYIMLLVRMIPSRVMERLNF
ncbi:MAG: SDR family NAD(P)-dependent oxidoreductase [Chloroflexota bacterium]|nr:SDR family NAD(P)-dependent oxidoreductase [Chloroflexota bacterium]